MPTSASEPIFTCVWCRKQRPLGEAADDPATIDLDCLDDVAELEERERVSSLREVA